MMKNFIKKSVQFFGYDLVKLSKNQTGAKGKTHGPLLAHHVQIDIFQHAEKTVSNNQIIEQFKTKLLNKTYQIESFACPICEQSAFTDVAWSNENFRWGICQECGLLQNYQRLLPTHLNQFYESGEYQVICMNNLDDDIHYQIEYQVNALCFIDVFQQLNIDISNKHILEIGCGSGGILRALQDKGAHVYGFDIDPHRIEAGKKYIKDLYVQDAMSQDFPLPPHVDFIILSNILEHLNDPCSFLKTLWNNLQKLGDRAALKTRILIDVPNLETVSHYSQPSFLGFLHIAHLWYFNSITLERLLNQAGFAIDAIFSREASFTLIAKPLDAPPINHSNAYWNSISSINFSNYLNEDENLQTKAQQKLQDIFSKALT